MPILAVPVPACVYGGQIVSDFAPDVLEGIAFSDLVVIWTHGLAHMRARFVSDKARLKGGGQVAEKAYPYFRGTLQGVYKHLLW